jgi:polar amino acid transport system substrate-binding protein
MHSFWCTFTCLFLLSLSVHSEPYPESNIRQPIIISVEEWPGYANRDGSGFIFDLLKAVYKPSGLKLSYQFIPYKRTLHKVAEGSADIAFGIYQDSTDETKRQLLISYHPFLEEQVEAIYLTKRIQSWRGTNSLKDTEVALIRGYDYDQYLGVKIKAYYVNDYKQALHMLLAERVSFVIGEQLLTETYLPKYLKEGHSLSRQRVFNRHNYTGFTPSERGKQLLKLYDKGIEDILISGELHNIYHKWNVKIPSKLPPPTSKQKDSTRILIQASLSTTRINHCNYDQSPMPLSY